MLLKLGGRRLNRAQRVLGSGGWQCLESGGGVKCRSTRQWLLRVDIFEWHAVSC